MRCPYCGSTNVVWDEERGEVVCMDCGSVIDRIYVLRKDYEERSPIRSYQVRGNVGVSRATKEFMKLLDNVKHNKKLRGRAIIDSNSFFNYINGKIGRVKIIRLSTPYLLSIRRNQEVSQVLKLINKYPRLNSRTERAKIALALIAISFIKERQVSVSEVSRVTGLSRMHVRRLIKELRTNKAFMGDVYRSLIAPIQR